jgi:hypothetical protein
MLLRATLEFVLIVVALFLIGGLTSCGPQQVTVDGTITHKFEIDMSNLEKYFKTQCGQEEPTNVENCVNVKIAEFLDYMLKQ